MSRNVSRALVTGATGFVGSNLVGGLLEASWQVSVITRPDSSIEILAPYSSQVDIHVHDGSMKSMSGIVAASKPDVVYHLAAMVSADHREEDIDQMVTSNVLFSTQLAEAMFRNGANRLVNTETFWQHQTGTDDFVPVCLYAATKQGFRDILQYYVHSCHLNAISLVLYDTYGANDPRKKLFSLLKQSVRDGTQLDMTLGEQLVDIVHVDDVVAAYLRAGDMLLEKDHKLETYAVSSGCKMTLRELVERVEREAEVQIKLNWGGKSYRPNEVMTPWQGEQLPGWQPKVDLASGLREVFRDLD